MKILDTVLDFQVEPIQNIIEKAKHATPKQTVFYGDSLIQGFSLAHYFPNVCLYNCGVNGATSALLLQLGDDAIGAYQPKEAFILIGTNDLGRRYCCSVGEIVKNVQILLEQFWLRYALEKVYIISPLPIIEKSKAEGIRNNHSLKSLGKSLQAVTHEKLQLQYIDVYDAFLDDQKGMDQQYTEDGLHLNAKGYAILSEHLRPYIEK
ncbi:MAG: SGNH/GDSL hydrolase family protein [Breznakia sp.]